MCVIELKAYVTIISDGIWQTDTIRILHFFFNVSFESVCNLKIVFPNFFFGLFDDFSKSFKNFKKSLKWPNITQAEIKNPSSSNYVQSNFHFRFRLPLSITRYYLPSWKRKITFDGRRRVISSGICRLEQQTRKLIFCLLREGVRIFRLVGRKLMKTGKNGKNNLILLYVKLKSGGAVAHPTLPLTPSLVC